MTELLALTTLIAVHQGASGTELSVSKETLRRKRYNKCELKMTRVARNSANEERNIDVCVCVLLSKSENCLLALSCSHYSACCSHYNISSLVDCLLL